MTAPIPNSQTYHTPWRTSRQRGQGMVEYTLIAALVILALIAILSTIGPVVSAVFDNTVGAFDPESTPVADAQRDAVLTLVAEYTPDTTTIGTEEPSESINNPPVAVDDLASTDQNVALNLLVLSNDYDPDGDPLTIIVVDGTTAQGGTATIHDNGTPTNPSDDYIVYVPRTNFIGTDTFTYTISDGHAGSDTATVTVEVLDPSLPPPTPAPSPTPSDTIHDAPFYDPISNPDWWRLNQGDVFLGYEDWEVKWYTWSGSTPADVDAAMAGPPACVTTQPYDQDIHFFWGYGGPAPGGACAGNPWRTDYFAAQWTRTFGVAEDVTVYLTTIANEGVQVIIDGELVSAISTWDLVSTTQYRSTTYTFTGGVEHTITVRFFEHTHTATVGFLIHDGSDDDVGVCNWSMSDEYTHTDPTAWSDFPGGDYYNSSQCHIALRGAIDLSTLTAPPRMTFWDRWRLANYDKAWLQIREYGAGGPWYQRLLHAGFSQQLVWTRQVIDLASFSGYNADTGQPVSLDWTGKTIEFRFLLATDSSSTGEGWWIDDVAVEDNALKVYTVGFQDDMEAGIQHWLPGGTWALSSELTRSGSSAWSDSPGTFYAPNSQVILQLDGVVDLTDPASVDPELVFYHAWDLGTNDKLFVEVSTDGTSWTSLTPSNPNGALRTGSSVNHAFVRQAISLNSAENPYQDRVFYLRFRLLSDGSGEGGGWWIDDVILQNRLSGYLPYPFFDDTESGADYWVADGRWNISPEAAHSGASAWSDSPGTAYTHQTETALQTIGQFQLLPGAVTQPELSFWHRRDLGANDKFYVEASTDGGVTWQTLWSYQYTDATTEHPEAPGTPRNEFNRQLAWEYVAVDMSWYVGTPFYIRFRLEALSGTQVGDGVWIDDIRLAEHSQNVHQLPFVDTMEGTALWRAGGTWGLSNEAARGGTYAWSDSPGGFYGDNTWSVLELSDPISLAGLNPRTDFPVLYWWDRFALGNLDYARVQVSTQQGLGWSPWQEVYQQYFTTTLSWDRRQVDLRPYIGQTIRLRFVLDALQNVDTGDGWWIDNVSVELYNPTVVAYTSFSDSAANLSRWVADGTWNIGDLNHDLGSGAMAFGSGSWSAYFYDLMQYGGCGGSTDNARATNAMQGTAFKTAGPNCNQNPQLPFTPYSGGAVQLDEIDFTCDAASSPHPNGTCSTTPWKSDHDHLAIRFERDWTVTEAGYHNFTLTYDDGARLFVDGSELIGNWTDLTPGSPARSATASTYLAAGSHHVTIWYYETTGPAVIQLSMTRSDFSFHDSPGGTLPPDGTPYMHQGDMALTLNPLINMTGAVQPAIYWYQSYDLGNYDCIVAEVSLPYVAFDQWFELYRQCGSATNLAWTPQLIFLRGPIEAGLGLPSGSLYFSGIQLAFRFRLDSRIDADTGDGWWIDDIAFVDPSIAPVLECVRNNGGGSYTAVFGYQSTYPIPITIEVGANNAFSPAPSGRGQPTVFEPGRRYSVFSVNFDGSDLTWTIQDPSATRTTATANSGSAACSS